MAYITLDKKKLNANYRNLNRLFSNKNIDWAIVTKVLCGSKAFVKEVLDLDIKEVCDARISNLKLIKTLRPEIQTVYIKPPAKKSINNIIKYADASFNTELKTIQWLSKAAMQQNKIHKVIIMIEMGDLREGVLGEELLEFYAQVFNLPNIRVTGLGTNLNCMHGIMPSPDKLVQLSLYKQLIEAKFNRKIPWLTGGTSVVIPLLLNQQLPKGINHFRVGESLFFGNNLFNDEPLPNMETNVFRLHAEVIEVHEKPKVPIGITGENPSGEGYVLEREDLGKKSYRAILDIGVLDVSKTDYLYPIDKNIEFIGGSSDMLVLDLGKNKNNIKVGDVIPFNLKYMGALRLLNSAYVEKVVVEE